MSLRSSSNYEHGHTNISYLYRRYFLAYIMGHMVHKAFMQKIKISVAVSSRR